VDDQTAIEETLLALNNLVVGVNVHHIGCSNLSVRQLAKAIQLSKTNGWASFSFLQAYYSVAGRDVEYELLPFSQEEGLGVLPCPPLAGGYLTGKYRRAQDSPEGSRRTEFDFPPVGKGEAYNAVEVMDKIAEDKDVSIPQIALAWLLHQPGVTAPIIGAKKMSQLEDNLASTEINLTEGEVAKISKTTEPQSIYPQWMVERMKGEE
jgi:aryl-alcohol dehydrogenase-like predicted oxidoreductase